MTTLTLPVPRSLSAIYFVPVGPEDDPAALARRNLPLAVGEPLLGIAFEALDAQRVIVEGWPARELPTPPYDLLAAMGSTPEQISALAGASRLAVVIATGKPGRGTHEWVARAVAATVGLAAGAPVVDVFTPRMLEAVPALRSVPRGSVNPPLAGWVWVPYSPGDDGALVTTKGLGRFGLPELRTVGVPDQLAPAWCQALTGIGGGLLDVWEQRLASWGDEPAFVEVPATFVVEHHDVRKAYGLEPDPGWRASVEVSLSLDPLYPDDDVFLTVRAPDDVAVSHQRYLADTGRALRGRMAAPPPVAAGCPGCAMEEAMHEHA